MEFRYGRISKTRLVLLEQQQNWIVEQIWTEIEIYHYLFIVFLWDLFVFPMKRKFSVAEMNTIQIPFYQSILLHYVKKCSIMYTLYT